MARAVSDLHRDYEQHKRRRGVLDFDDLLLECTRLLRTEPSFRDAQRWLFRHVFVDEFQDLNQTQFNLLQAWVGDRRDLCVVGDADQAIYAWNGADASFLTDFATNYPSTTVVSLETNHRSSAAIVRASDAVLGRAPRTTGRGAEGSPPTITRFESAHEEAVGIARLVRQRRPPGARWRRSAVLTRTNEQLSLISQVFTQLEIPHRLRGQAGMLRIPEVAAVVDQLVDAGPDIATIANDLVEELDDGPARTVAEMANQFVDEDPTAHGSAFRQWLRTFRPNDLDGMYDAVDLVTFHAAKGLEWPHVVVAGLEDGFVPIGDQDEEERRLLFVAVSRAEEQLDLTWAGHRDVGGLRASIYNALPTESVEALTAFMGTFASRHG